MKKTIKIKRKELIGEIEVPGDKSISHRSIMLGSMASGRTVIHNFLISEDCMRTVQAFRSLGVDIEVDQQTVVISSRGVQHFLEPKQLLNMGNSGTTVRLLLGILASLPINVEFTGDSSLSLRPMDRVIIPLKQMGANIESHEGKLPIKVLGGSLKPIDYQLPVDSAQVKSAILLAGLNTEGQTTVHENHLTRDHTENLLPVFGGQVNKNNRNVSVIGPQNLYGSVIHVPGDISSAAFWIAGAVITPNSRLTIKNVGLNPTRMGFIHVLKRMGAKISTEIKRFEGKEPVGDLFVQYSTLEPTTVLNEEIPSMIDEIPLLALVATQANGSMKIENIKELKFKETDRVKATVNILNNLGASVEEMGEGIYVKGKSQLSGGWTDSKGDHRMAMLASVASLICDSPVTISDTECINISYPEFLNQLNQITCH